jgi:hypothetical protein
VPFKIELLENGTPYTLLDTDTVSIEWLKPNGQPFLQDGDIIYGTNYIEIITPEAVAQYSGSGTFNIIISDGDVRKGTIRREYKVVATSMAPGSVSEDVITDAITELRDLNDTLLDTIAAGNLSQYAKVVDLDTLKSQLPINVLTLGVDNTGTTDNTSLFNTILSSHKNLFFPAGTYKGTLYLPSNVTLQGIKPSYNTSTLKLENGTIIGAIQSWGGKNSTIKNIGVEGTGDGIRLAQGCENIKVFNCVTNVSGHGYLFEELGTTMKECKAIECESYNGIHGFVSKSNETSFVRCTAYYPTTNGFVLCSDNMLSNDQISNCINNNCIDCKVYGNNVTKYGLTTYAREYYETYNNSQIYHKNLNVRNIRIYDCVNGINVGEITGGSSTVARNIEYMTVKDMQLSNCTTKALILNRCTYLDIKDGYVKDSLNVTNRLTTNTSAVAWSCVEVCDGLYIPDFIISNNESLPTISYHLKNSLIKMQNTTTTTLNNFSYAKIGEIINVIIDDEYTTINSDSPYFKINGSLTGKGKRITLKLNSDYIWEEISRSA